MYFLQKLAELKMKNKYMLSIIVFAMVSLALTTYAHQESSNIKMYKNGFIKIENGQFMLGNQPFVMKGFNYFPRNYHKSSMVTWDWEEVDEELGLGKTLGANVVRTFIDYGFSTDSLANGDYNDGINDIWEVENYYKPTRQYISAIDTFLSIASKHELRVIFSLFDYMPGWAFIDQREKYIEFGKNYLNSLIGHFRDDTTIIAWDLLNEGDLLTRKYNTPLSKILEFYKEIYHTIVIDSLDSNHLVTAVFGIIDTVPMSEEFVDFISFQFPDTDQAFYGKLIRKLKSTIKDKKIPIISAEFSHSTRFAKGASEREHTIRITNYYDHCFNVESSKLNGALFWTLTDFSEHPKTNLSRLITPISNSERFELYKGILDLNLQKKTSFDLIKKYFKNHYRTEDRLDFKYSKILKGNDLDPNDTRHFAVAFHDKIEFLARDRSVIDFISLSDTSMTKHLPGKGWYLLEKWDYYSYWGQKAGNLDSITSMYINPPDSTCFIKLRLNADSLNTKLVISYSGFTLDTINLITDPSDYTIAFNFPPRIIKLSNFSFKNDKSYTLDLDTCVTDKNHSLKELNWDIFPQKPELKFEFNNHKISFLAPNWNDSTDVKFIVKDPKGALDSMTIKATVMLPSFIEIKESNFPIDFFINQNYPNPFNTITTINFGIPKISEINISIYNLKGQLVEKIFNGKKEPGYYSINWNAINNSSGLYFIKLEAGGNFQTRKCLLIK